MRDRFRFAFSVSSIHGSVSIAAKCLRRTASRSSLSEPGALGYNEAGNPENMPNKLPSSKFAPGITGSAELPLKCRGLLPIGGIIGLGRLPTFIVSAEQPIWKKNYFYLKFEELILLFLLSKAFPPKG